MVLTNPTHFAVALRYRPGVDAAPIVVARGRGATAEAIRELAAEHEVPLLSYPQLTRALYYTTRPGQIIREDLYMAVATVLAFVFNLDAAMASGRPPARGRGPAGAALRHQRPARGLRAVLRAVIRSRKGMERVEDQDRNLRVTLARDRAADGRRRAQRLDRVPTWFAQLAIELRAATPGERRVRPDLANRILSDPRLSLGAQANLQPGALRILKS